MVPNAGSLHRRVGQKMGVLGALTDLNETDHKQGHRRVYTVATLLADIAGAGLAVETQGTFMLKPLSNAQMDGLDRSIADARSSRSAASCRAGARRSTPRSSRSRSRSSTTVGRPMIPLVDLAAQYAAIKAEVGAAIDSVLAAQSFIQGPFVTRFEAEFNAAHGARFGVGCSNGTAAIQLALEALKVGAGDEVITVPNTFIATVEAIVRSARSRSSSTSMRARTASTAPPSRRRSRRARKAILPVHLFGNPCDMDAVMAVAARHGLAVVEDCAQAHLATFRGRHVGTIGDAGTFSFYPGKNLGAYGDAGHVFTRNEALDTAVRKLLDHGRMGKYEHDVIGANNRMDAIQAAVLSVKLRHLAAWTRTRRAHAALYRELLRGSGAVPVEATDGAEPVHHLMVIEVDERDRVAEHLHKNGIATGIHYPLPLHLQPALAYLKRPRGSFPVTRASGGAHPEPADLRLAAHRAGGVHRRQGARGGASV